MAIGSDLTTEQLHELVDHYRKEAGELEAENRTLRWALDKRIPEFDEGRAAVTFLEQTNPDVLEQTKPDEWERWLEVCRREHTRYWANKLLLLDAEGGEEE
jgi:hypothetical protein